MFIRIDWKALVTAHPEVTLSLLSFVVIVSKTPIDRMHGLFQRDGCGGLKEEMHVRIHQFVIEQAELMLLFEEPQQV
jgi:hypothetical protein